MTGTSHLEDGTLHAWLDGELDGTESQRVEAHLEECQECRDRANETREEARRAASILAGLEPGPAHAPDWREIESRAGARDGRDAAAGDVPGSREATDPGDAGGPADPTGPTEPTGPAWFRTVLPWAASLVLAFGLGWLVSDMGGGPLGAPETAPPGRAPRTAALEDGAPASGSRESASGLGGDAAESEQPAAVPEEALETTDSTTPEAAAQEGRAAPDPRIAPDSRTATAGSRESEAMAGGRLPPSEPAPGEAREDAALKKAQKKATRPEPSGQQASAREETEQQPPVRLDSTLAPTRSRDIGMRALADRAPGPGEAEAYRADADGAAPGSVYLGIQPAEAEAWLDRPVLRLPGLDLLRAEVGSGALLGEPFSPGPVVRLLYADAAGQRIWLLQQRVESPEVDAVFDWEIDPEAEPETDPEAGPEAQPEAGPEAEPEAGPDDAREFREERILTVTPSGTRSLRWREDGLIVVLSADLDADALQSLADRVR